MWCWLEQISRQQRGTTGIDACSRNFKLWAESDNTWLISFNSVASATRSSTICSRSSIRLSEAVAAVFISSIDSSFSSKLASSSAISTCSSLKSPEFYPRLHLQLRLKVLQRSLCCAIYSSWFWILSIIVLEPTNCQSLISSDFSWSSVQRNKVLYSSFALAPFIALAASRQYT